MNSVSLFLILFFVAGLTDVADGYIARNLNLVTPLGARIDSIADLFFYLSVLFVLFIKYRWGFTENVVLFRFYK